MQGYIVINIHTKHFHSHTFLTPGSSVVVMARTQSITEESIVETVEESLFRTKAKDKVKPDWSSSHAKLGIIKWSRIKRLITELTTDNISLKLCPETVTNSSPSFVEAKFHTTLKVIQSID